MLPVRFIYSENDEKVYVAILANFTHHFTGKTYYKVRLEGESGWFGEYLYLEDVIKNLLERRVEE